MKKSIVLFFVLMLSINYISIAKINRKITNNDFGIKTGMTIAFPFGKLVEKADGIPVPAPLLGFNYRRYLKKKFSLQVGIDYYWTKTKFETPYANFSYAGDIEIIAPDGSKTVINDTVNIFYALVKDGLFKNKYISLPVTANYHVNKVWSLNLGAYVAYLLKGGMTGKATRVVLGDGSSKDFLLASDVPFDQSNQFSRWDYGINMGTNAQLPNGFNFDLKINVGVASLFRKDFTAPPGVYRNVFFQGALGYRLGSRSRFIPNEDEPIPVEL